MRMRTAGGYLVQVVHTDRGQHYRVTRPNGLNVPLNPWDPQHSPEITTWEQLAEVLARVGEDPATLEQG